MNEPHLAVVLSNNGIQQVFVVPSRQFRDTVVSGV
jgi:hypothetical protein